jgi:eukaryotic-like serine/threonine-protein kinase
MIDASVAMQLNTTDPLDSSLDECLAEQIQQWTRGDRPCINSFFHQYPALRAQPEALVELINQEIVLRQLQGETPLPEDYLIDFPDLAEALSRLFEVHAALPLPAEPGTAAIDERAHNHANGKPVEPVSLPMVPGYDILGTLGYGGMGVVYLARHCTLGRKVALKLLHAGRQSDPQQRARFEREAAAVAKCQHPNLVQIHEIGEYDGQSYLALEYVDGGTLARSLAAAPQSPQAAAALVETLARAIDHVHSRGIVHRDLKPANVLLTADGQPKITDFGLAKLDHGTTQTEVGAIMGTLAYMAPEQAAGNTKVGPRADIHALGAILYEALTGRPPFRAESPELIYHQLLHSDVVPPSRSQPGIPRDLEAICLKCLEKSPAARYATALELAEDLRRFQHGEPIRARRIGRLRRSLRWTRRHPWQMTAAATLFVAALAFIAMFARHNIELKAEIRRTQGQAALARLNYQEAQSTIQAMLGRLADRRLAGSPRLLELRRDQQDNALTFYDRMLHRIDTNDPAVRADMARALVDGSVLQCELGQKMEAEKSARRALSLVVGLRHERPADRVYLNLHVDCLTKLGVYLHHFKESDEAVPLARKAVELAEQLARALPTDPGVQNLLASCHNNYGDVLMKRQPGEAGPQFQKAIEIREQIDPIQFPGVTLSLAESLINNAVALWRVREFRRAEQIFRRAEGLLISLAGGPEKRGVGVTFCMAELYLNWSGMLHLIGRASESIDRANAGLDLLEPYVRAEPEDLAAREIKLKLHGNRAYALAASGRHLEAAGEWTKVIELSAQPVPPSYRIRLAVDLLRAGETDRAMIQSQMLKPAPDVSAEDQYNMGCLFCLSACAAQRDKNSSFEERKRLAESRIAEALGWLKSAARLGFFRNPACREYARHDGDLTILANRDEFRKLIDQDFTEP